MMRNMRIMNFVTISILCPHIFWMFKPTIATNPVMTKASIDVGNIISIIIPESPESNINIDQLTLDFRRQLERISKQSRVNKLESGLVTLKNVLPELLHEEKKRVSPLIHRSSSNPKNSNSIRPIFSKDISTRNIPKQNNPPHKRRNFPNWINLKKYHHQHHNIATTTKRPNWPIRNRDKFNRKYSKLFSNELNIWNDMKNNRNNKFNTKRNWNKFTSELNPIKYLENSYCDNRNGRTCTGKLSDEPNENDDQSPSLISSEKQQNHDQLPITTDNNDNNNDYQQLLQKKLPVSGSNSKNPNMIKRNMTTNDCSSIILIDIDGQVYSICNNTNLISVLENSKDELDFPHISNNNETSTTNNLKDNDKIIVPVNIEVDDFKNVEKIIENPQLALEQMNSSGFNIDNIDINMNGNLLKRSNPQESNDNLENAAILTSINVDTNQFNIHDDNIRESKNNFEFNEKKRDFTHDNIYNNNKKHFELTPNGLGYKHHRTENIPKVMHELNFDNENFEIRIQRSIDDNFQLRKSINTQLQEFSTDNDNIELKPIANQQIDLLTYLKHIKNSR